MTEMEQFRPAGAPDRMSQATAVEQSRAVAEVLAQVQAARQFPRNVDAARAEVQRACDSLSFAERALYSMPRDGGTVTGPSVHLAREIARAWGNIDHGLRELRQDLERGESELLAYAHDLQTNTRSSSSYIVPHVRDAKGKRKPITSIGGVNENNANQGARRVRAAIFSVIPSWLLEEAVAACLATVKRGDGGPLADRCRKAIQAFGRGGITQEQLVDKVGRPVAGWTADDVAELEVLFRSLARKEITREEAFPSRVRGADILAGDPAAERDPAEPPADDPWMGQPVGGEPA